MYCTRTAYRNYFYLKILSQKSNAEEYTESYMKYVTFILVITIVPGSQKCMRFFKVKTSIQLGTKSGTKAQCFLNFNGICALSLHILLNFIPYLTL